MAEVGTAWISIVPEVSKITPEIAKAVGAAEPAVTKQGSGIGSKLGGAMSKTLKRTAVGAGVAAGAGVAGGLAKGLGRLNAIEQAQSKLGSLGITGTKLGTTMDNALSSVKGTAFGIGEAASVASMMVAAGIKPGQELEGVLTGVADSAAVAGTDITEMGDIWSKVAAKGRVDGQIINQLVERGVPALQILADELGVTAEEASKMVSSGQVDFKTFSSAMEKYVGGAAKKMGDTTRGAFMNLGAAAGRLGATLAGPFYDQAGGAFRGVTSALDALDEKAKPVMAALSTWISGKVVPALRNLGREALGAWQALSQSDGVKAAVAGTGVALKSMAEAGVALAPALGNVASSLAQAAANLGVAGWQTLNAALSLTGTTLKIVAPILEVVSGFLADHPSLVTAAAVAWGAFKYVPGLLGRLRGSTEPVTNSLKRMGDQMAVQTHLAKQQGVELSRLGAATATLRAHVPVFSKMGAAYDSAAAKATVLGRAQGVMAAGFTGASSAVGGLVGALGGPLNVALMGAGLLLANQMNATASAKAAHEQMTASVSDASKAQTELSAHLQETNGALDDQGLAIAARIAKGSLAEFTAEGERTRGVIEKVGEATVGLDQFMSKIPGMMTDGAAAAADNRAENKQLKAAYDELQATAQSMGMTMDDVNNAVASGGPQYDALMSKLRGSGEAGDMAANELAKARSEIEMSIESARRADPAYAAIAQAVSVLADEASSAEDKLSALRTIMQELGLAPKDAERAMMEAAAAIDEIAESAASGIDGAKGLGDALFDMSGKLDPTNDNSRLLFDTMSGLGDELLKVASNGGDTAATFEQMKPKLQQLQEQFGLTDEQMQGLIQQFGLMPDKLETLVQMEGLDASQQGLQALALAVEANPDKKNIEFTLEDQGARDRLTELGFEVEAIPGTNNVRVNVDNQEAMFRLNELAEIGFPKVDGQRLVATADLDATGVMLNANSARQMLVGLDMARPTPLANMDISQLDSRAIDALNRVGLLNGQTPTPQAFMNIDQLSQEQQIALAQVFDLDSKNPTPIADLSKEQLDAKANAASGRLNQLHGQVTNPTINANDAPAQGAVSRVKSALASIPRVITSTINVVRSVIGGGRADGGIAGYATGGRLPVSGPGTHVTDGIMGVDGNGMPTARVDAGEWVINRKASAKHHRLLSAINRGDPCVDDLPAFADGGVVSEDELDRFARGLEGKPYVWGGVNWGDCSGAMSALANFATGRAPFGSRFATGNQQSELLARGFTLGLGGPGDLRMGWFNGGPYGGHTAGTLPNGINVEMGGGRGNGQYGGPAAGASHPQFTDHAFLPIVDIGKMTDDFADHIFGGVPTSGVGEVPDEYGPGYRDDYTGGASGTASNGHTYGNHSYGNSTEVQGPSSWSEAAGIAASAFAKGQVSDILGVLGIPDGVPAMEAQKEAMGILKGYDEEVGEREAGRGSLADDVVASRKELEEERSKPDSDPEKVASLEAKVTSLEGELRRTDGMVNSDAGKLLRQVSKNPNVLADPQARAGAAAALGQALEAITGSPEIPSHVTPALVNALRSTMGSLPGFATGGRVRGRGGPTDDDILAWLSNGEAVLNARAAGQNAGFIDALNDGLSIGDMVGAAAKAGLIAAGAGPAMPLVDVASKVVGSATDAAGRYVANGVDTVGRELGRWATVAGDAMGGITGAGGDSYTFVAENRTEMAQIFRREQAKGRRGKVGAR